MKPLQVYLDEADMVRLEDWARQRKMTKSQAIRAAVRALTAPSGDDPLLSISAMIHDRLPADCSEHFDRYLQETFVAEPATTYTKRHRPTRPRPRR